MSRNHFGKGRFIVTHEEIKKLAFLILGRIGTFKKINLGRIGRFDPVAIRDTYQLIYDSVKEVELFSKAFSKLTSDEKKNIVVEILDELVNIPWCPAFIERMLFTWTINFIVYIFNSIGGKEWIDTLFSKEGDK
jgi:hypothetical protein